MQSFSEVQIVVATTLFLLVISSFIVIFIVIHQNKYRRHIKEKEEIKSIFQQELLKATLEIQDDTMHAIAQEIHDNIGQVLSLSKIHLATMAQQTENNLHDKIDATKNLVSKAIVDLRDLSKSLNKEYIIHEPLTELLKAQLINLNKAQGYLTRFKLKGPEATVEPGKQLIVFRMVQESLQNVIKHAAATSITIDLTYTSDCLQLSITDNGKGFDTTNYVKGTGIHNMKHRAKLIGATYSINSEGGKGTHVEITLPLTSTFS